MRRGKNRNIHYLTEENNWKDKVGRLTCHREYSYIEERSLLEHTVVLRKCPLLVPVAITDLTTVCLE